MHMTDALLSPAVGAAFCAVSALAAIYSARQLKKNINFEKKLPIMGVMGAFVFAAQMINFTIPGTGSSGHIGGGVLLSAILGPFSAFLTIIAVLIIQCLFFADGGILALGCNIFNMGIIPCLLIYPLVFNFVFKKSSSTKKIVFASVLSCVIGLQIGSLGVVLETLLSQIIALPFTSFLIFMQPIHLPIGLVEGFVTGTVLCFIFKTRPEILDFSNENIERNIGFKNKTVILFSVLAILLGGVFSLIASSNPDGLEWSYEKATGSSEMEVSGEIHENIQGIQDKTAILPDYNFVNKSTIGTSFSGVIGAIITFATAFLIGFILKRKRKNKCRN